MIDNISRIEPFGNNVIIVEFYEDNDSKLIVPGSADAQYWEVIAVGPGILLPDGKRSRPLCRIGDVVAIGAPPGVQVFGNTIQAGGKTYKILSDEFIVARCGTIHTLKRAIENERIIIPEAPSIQ